MLGNGPPVWACDVISADSGLGSRSTIGRPPLIGCIDCSLATRNRRRGWGDVGNLEGSTGPRRVVQSLRSGAAAAVLRLASPRPVSGRVSTDDRDGVADRRQVVVKMRPSPAAGRSKRRARRRTDMVLRALLDDKTAGIGRISVRPRIATR